MENKILLYCWGSVCEPLLEKALAENNVEWMTLKMEIKDYHADAKFAQIFIDLIHKEKINIVLSYDYFPIISSICEINHIPYVSWIYDCPQYTIYSKTITNLMNYIFCFDKIFTEKIRDLNAVHVYHLPLAADPRMIDTILSNEQRDNSLIDKYSFDISFVGDLYNGEKNRIKHTKLSDYAIGYVEGLIRSQLSISGYNLLKDSLNHSIVDEIVKECSLSLGESYLYSADQLVADAIGLEVTAREREAVIERLSNDYKVAFYSGSEVSEEWKKRELLSLMGYADYKQEMPYIFHNSKINLNITSRTIESGIPQRVLDIMSCQGFCLTNYQPEIAENFIDGEEVVMYSSVSDLVQKADYYLKHEKERREIARRGYEKIKENFSIKKSLQKLLETVEYHNKKSYK